MQGNLFSRVDIYSAPDNLQCNEQKRQSGALVIKGTFSLSNASGNKSYMQSVTVSVFASQILANMFTIDICLSVFPILWGFFTLEDTS